MRFAFMLLLLSSQRTFLFILAIYMTWNRSQLWLQTPTDREPRGSLSDTWESCVAYSTPDKDLEGA